MLPMEVHFMQTIAVFTAPVSGIITINGRFAGETGPESPLIMPVTPNGALYTIFHPFSRKYRPCAHKLRTVSGRFDPDCAGDMCHMLSWPGGICEFSLEPPAAYPPESEFGALDGRATAILRGEAAMLRVGGSSLALPAGAQLPEAHTLINEADIYTGSLPTGRYAAAFRAADLTPLMSITADTIEFTENGLIRTMTAMHDTAGHSLMELWQPSADGLTNTGGEYMWADGAPAWPETAENAAIAALEAAMLGLDGEASGYLAPRLRAENPLAAYAGYDAVLPIKYAPPTHEPAIALIKKLSPRAAEATPLYYHAIPEGSTQGKWLIDSLHT